jgi:uncharacterized membrane protein HdeD (DUF308 family)
MAMRARLRLYRVGNIPRDFGKGTNMSGVQLHGERHGLGHAHIVAKWGWFVALGIVLIAAGVFALGDVVAVTLVSVIFIGAMLLVGGVFQIVHAFMTRTWSAFLFQLLGGALYVVGGLLIMDEPEHGSVLITLLLLMALIVGGVLRVTIALRHREIAGWWLMLLSGVISLVIGVLLFMELPWSGLWVLGTLIAVELIMMGMTWLQFGFTLRRLAQAS